MSYGHEQSDAKACATLQTGYLDQHLLALSCKRESGHNGEHADRGWTWDAGSLGMARSPKPRPEPVNIQELANETGQTVLVRFKDSDDRAHQIAATCEHRRLFCKACGCEYTPERGWHVR